MFLTYNLLDDDNKTFSNLYDKYKQPLFRLAMSYLKNAALAEETVQEAFIVLFKNYEKIMQNPTSKPWNFLVIIVKRVSLKTLRNEKCYSERIDIDELAIDDGSEPLWSKYQAVELFEDIKDAVDKLKQDDQNLLTLRAVYDMTYTQIAEIMGLSEKNVSVRLTRIRKKLRESIAEKTGECNETYRR